ncbi:MAG: aminopeptidase P N-terminal domain-containing protein [Proteobacteria bacterium]|nr:aminopeptidase P N-terminal domain-containing protein [Pseudomonadota bacterium]
MKAMLMHQKFRSRVFDRMKNNSIAVLNAAQVLHRNNDTDFPFRQDSYFYYLSGFNESEALMVLSKKQNSNQFILFCQDKDPKIEQWTGPRAGLAGAKLTFGADEAFHYKEAPIVMQELLANVETVYYLINQDISFDRKLCSWIEATRKKIRLGISSPFHFVDLRHILDECRLIKTTDELQLLRKSAQISATAHLKAMQHCEVGMKEYELEAILLYEFYRQGSRYPAYPSIVGAGNNACTLHYNRNDSIINNNELVLIDAGAEYEYYAADITRTFPVNGKFTFEQQAIYELVLEAQMGAIAQIKPNAPWQIIQDTIVKILVQGLVDLKILQGNVQTLIEEKAYLPFYMHNSGHWLGMDVHDVGEYKVNGQWRTLSPGMVFTVEPGLYLSAQNTQIAEKWRGIGVRIEDDLVVTQTGYEVMTDEVVKKPADIEKLMQNRI